MLWLGRTIFSFKCGSHSGRRVFFVCVYLGDYTQLCLGLTCSSAFKGLGTIWGASDQIQVGLCKASTLMTVLLLWPQSSRRFWSTGGVLLAKMSAPNIFPTVLCVLWICHNSVFRNNMFQQQEHPSTCFLTSRLAELLMILLPCVHKRKIIALYQCW